MIPASTVLNSSAGKTVVLLSIFSNCFFPALQYFPPSSSFTILSFPLLCYRRYSPEKALSKTLCYLDIKRYWNCEKKAWLFYCETVDSTNEAAGSRAILVKSFRSASFTKKILFKVIIIDNPEISPENFFSKQISQFSVQF